MEDREIIDLFWQRKDDALQHTQEKYGIFCRQIASQILHCPEDVEECLNDTWLALWHVIPPEKPQRLGAYVCRVARNQALKRYAFTHAQKRFATVELPFEELSACLPEKTTVEGEMDTRWLGMTMDAFLHTLPKEQRVVFLRRYWFCDSIATISEMLGCSQSRVKSMLFRLRNKLQRYLEKEELL